MKTVVLITAYNEERNIGPVIEKIVPSYDLYVVDDGSTDKTAEIAGELGAHVIRMPMNIGQGAATVAGYKFILENNAHDVIVKMDADGQHRPEEIGQFVSMMSENNCDIVVGSRRLGTNYKNAPFFRRTFLPAYTALINFVTGYKMTDSMCGFRAFRTRSMKKVITKLDNSLEPQYLAAELFVRFARAGLTVGEVPIHLQARKSGASYKGMIRYGFGVLRALSRALFDRH